MRRDKQMKDGTVDKEFKLELEYKHHFKTGEAVVRHEASLSTYDMTLTKLVKFQKDIETIFRHLKRIAKVEHNDLVKLEFYVSAYEDVPEYKDELGFPCVLRQLLFDCWRYTGTGAEMEDNGGVCLNPDERYTEPERAIWISFEKGEGGILEQIAGQQWVCDSMTIGY